MERRDAEGLPWMQGGAGFSLTTESEVTRVIGIARRAVSPERN
jgi:hypothetical protein